MQDLLRLAGYLAIGLGILAVTLAQSMNVTGLLPGGMAAIGGGMFLIGLMIVISGRWPRRMVFTTRDQLRPQQGLNARIEGSMLALSGLALVVAGLLEQFVPGGVQAALLPDRWRIALTIFVGLSGLTIGGLTVLEPVAASEGMLLSFPRRIVGMIFAMGGATLVAAGVMALYMPDLLGALAPPWVSELLLIGEI
jgi:hypothetical protein